MVHGWDRWGLVEPTQNVGHNSHPPYQPEHL
jgi:hypothetical protein